MSPIKWLIVTLTLTLVFAAGVVTLNFYVDHHAIRLALFTKDKAIRQTIFPDGINQHLFNPELIFRQPERFDSFIFGSSRTTVMDVSHIPGGRFFNMSYAQGLPAQHLAIIKAFLRRGIRIKTVVVGLDDFCFTIPADSLRKHLLRVMHPDVNGPSRLKIFAMYFFRKPGVEELEKWADRVFWKKKEGRFVMDHLGLNLGWMPKETVVKTINKPIFSYKVSAYKPRVFDDLVMKEAFDAIEEMISLSRTHGFKLIFFINPFYDQFYVNNAESLFTVKERLAKLTGYYDFSGFNAVTIDAVNYYEESHYRYHVGDMIMGRLFNIEAIHVPEDFGVWVTKQNINGHLETQRRELDAYLRSEHLK